MTNGNPSGMWQDGASGMAVLLAVLLAVLTALGGYWLGGRSDAQPTAAAPGTSSVAAKKGPKLLFYRNPMGLSDTSPTPKKDSMGMDYIPVYEGEEDEDPASAGQVRISTEKVQKLGVRSEAASLRVLGKTVRAVGRVEPDERRVFTISPKFEGYVERLHVNITGQAVSRGQPLFEVYSPELISAQREYAIASQGLLSLKDAGGEAQGSMRQLADASLMRLKNWDISEEQIKALAKSGETKRTLTFRSPVAGIVTEKKAVQGMRFMAGEALYQVADLSAVWVIADVFEQDIGLVKSGAKTRLKINAYPDRIFEGTVTYVYPTLKAETRTVPVRIELPNPGALLKPGMFAEVELPVAEPGKVVAVPASAVIDSGTRRIVLIQLKEGRFEPREVKLGARSDNYVEVVEGVGEGELVVVSANFLIDAESNLKAAIGGFGAAPGATVRSAAAVHQASGIVDGVDAKAGTYTISHGPVESLKWPAMSMEFKSANEALLKGIKPGTAISFEFVERGAGEWVITAVTPGSAAAPASPRAVR